MFLCRELCFLGNAFTLMTCSDFWGKQLLASKKLQNFEISIKICLPPAMRIFKFKTEQLLQPLCFITIQTFLIFFFLFKFRFIYYMLINKFHIFWWGGWEGGLFIGGVFEHYSRWHLIVSSQILFIFSLCHCCFLTPILFVSYTLPLGICISQTSPILTHPLVYSIMLLLLLSLVRY